MQGIIEKYLIGRLIPFILNNLIFLKKINKPK